MRCKVAAFAEEEGTAKEVDDRVSDFDPGLFCVRAFLTRSSCCLPFETRTRDGDGVLTGACACADRNDDALRRGGGAPDEEVGLDVAASGAAFRGNVVLLASLLMTVLVNALVLC